MLLVIDIRKVDTTSNYEEGVFIGLPDGARAMAGMDGSSNTGVMAAGWQRNRGRSITQKS